MCELTIQSYYLIVFFTIFIYILAFFHKNCVVPKNIINHCSNFQSRILWITEFTDKNKKVTKKCVFLFSIIEAPQVACCVGFSGTCDTLMEHRGFSKKCSWFLYSSSNFGAWYILKPKSYLYHKVFNNFNPLKKILFNPQN